MKLLQALRHPGIRAALAAALLFGAGTPVAKLLLADVTPWLLAGLLYLGSGLGLFAYRAIRHMPHPTLKTNEWLWLAGAITAGGIVGPVFLMFGLVSMPASGASLLLNAEGVFTALLAWFVFGENVDRRIALGMALIVAGAIVLSWPGDAHFAGMQPAFLILGACLAWAIDNNLTRKVSLSDATWIAAIKGLVAGSVNLLLAFSLGASAPAWPQLMSAMIVGLLAYGASLALFVVGLRHLGTARTGAYFSVAPFFGAVLAIPLLDEQVTTRLLAAGALMLIGIWLHVTEKHSHMHTHEAMVHEHEHVHDAHHQHTHDPPIPSGTRHTHQHRHEPQTHSHAHFPDAHHRHDH